MEKTNSSSTCETNTDALGSDSVDFAGDILRVGNGRLYGTYKAMRFTWFECKKNVDVDLSKFYYIKVYEHEVLWFRVLAATLVAIFLIMSTVGIVFILVAAVLYHIKLFIEFTAPYLVINEGKCKHYVRLRKQEIKRAKEFVLSVMAEKKKVCTTKQETDEQSHK